MAILNIGHHQVAGNLPIEGLLRKKWVAEFVVDMKFITLMGIKEIIAHQI